MSKSAPASRDYSYEELIGLQVALQRLGDGGVDRVVGERVVHELYKLGELRLPIAQNARKVAESVKDYTEARNGLIKEISGGDEIKATDREKAKRFQDAERILLDKRVPLELKRLKIDDLKECIAEMPTSVLTLLAPIVDGI